MYFNCAIILTVHVSTKHCLFVNAPPPPTTHPPTSLVIFSLLVLFLTLITVKKIFFFLTFLLFIFVCFVLFWERTSVSIHIITLYISIRTDENYSCLTVVEEEYGEERDSCARTRTHICTHTHARMHAHPLTPTHSLDRKERWVERLKTSWHRPVQSRVGPCGWAGVDVELSLMFIGLELVGVSRDEDVNVQLPLKHSQALHLAPGYHLVAMTQTDAELADSHHFLLRIVHVLQN